MHGSQRETSTNQTESGNTKGIKSGEQQNGWLYFAGIDARLSDQSPLPRLAMQWKRYSGLNTVEGEKYCYWVEEIREIRKNRQTTSLQEHQG